MSQGGSPPLSPHSEASSDEAANIFSPFSGILDDPTLSAAAGKMAEDRDFSRMAKQLHNTWQGDGVPQGDDQENSELMRLALSPFWGTVYNRVDELVAEGSLPAVAESPALSSICSDIQGGGMSAMMRYWNNKDVLEKLGEAMHFSSSGNVGSSAQSQKSVVHTTACDGNVEGLEKALSEGADVDEEDNGSRTALHFACAKGKVECAEVLLNAGAKVDALDQENHSALHYAAAYGRKECVALLIGKGADVSLQNKEGKTALDLAERKQHREVLELLRP